MIKFLIVLAMLASFFVPAQTATAAVPTQVQVQSAVELAKADPQRRCYGYSVKGKGKKVPYGTVNAEWRVLVYLEYRPCDTGSYAERYVVNFIPVDKGRCFRIVEWKVNPNVIGNYNPGTKNLRCSGQIKITEIWDLKSTWVYKGLPENQKCLGGVVTVNVFGAKDPKFSLPSLCLK